MRKLLYGIGVAIFAAVAAISVSGAPIPLFTPTSGCQEASQLMACLNNLISQLNGSSGGLVGFGTTANGSTSGLVMNGTVPNPTALGGAYPSTGPGNLHGVCVGGTSGECASQFTPTVANGQRGIVTFTTPVGAASQSSTLMVMNSYVSATSNCQAAVLSVRQAITGTVGAAGGAVGLLNMTPMTSIWSATTSQGALQMRLGNINAYEAAGTQTYNIGFWCQ